MTKTVPFFIITILLVPLLLSAQITWQFPQSEQRSVRLDGMWAVSSNNINTHIEASIPHYWKDLKLPGMGVVSYHIKLTNLPPNCHIKIPYVRSAYTLHSSDKLIAADGTVGSTEETCRGGRTSSITNLGNSTSLDTVELTLTISNYTFHEGGPVKHFTLGSKSELLRSQNLQISTHLFALGTLITMAIYHLLLFFFRREKVSLAFTLVSLSCAFHYVVVGDSLLFQLFPTLTITTLLRVKFLGFFALPAFAYYLQSLNRSLCPRRLSRVSLFITILFYLLVLILPAQIFTSLYPYYLALFLLQMVIILFFLFKGYVQGCKEGFIPIIGFMIVVLATIHDTLLLYGYVQTPRLLTWAFILYALLQSYIISRNLVNTLGEKEHLATELDNHKKALLELVQLRERLEKEESQERHIIHPEFLNAIMKSRQKIRKLGVSLINKAVANDAVAEQLHRIDLTLELIGGGPKGQTSEGRQIIVDLMQNALDLWESCTQKDRVHFAEESGIWAVYVNRDGWRRTQTLDKYFSLSTLPKSPRIRKVQETAEYILANCTEVTYVRSRVIELLHKL